MRILLIEDNKTTALIIKNLLKEHSHVTDISHTGEDGLEKARVHSEEYDVILLDILLPDIDGLEICKELRSQAIDIPILVLSIRDSTRSKVECLDNGADDYLTKPFEYNELIARINALHRRTTGQKQEKIKIRNLEIDPLAYEVKHNGKTIDLTQLEYRLLFYLMKNRGRVVPRSEIIEKVWDLHAQESVMSNSIDVHIKEIRKKIRQIKTDPIIITVRGVGYRCKAE